jgi:hypothetical protein
VTPLEGLQRFTPEKRNILGASTPMAPDPEGEWVRASDAEAALAEERERLSRVCDGLIANIPAAGTPATRPQYDAGIQRAVDAFRAALAPTPASARCDGSGTIVTTHSDEEGSWWTDRPCPSCPACAASPPPEPQEIWRARADAAVEALAFLAAHRRWDDGEHSMRVYAQEQLQSIARGEYLPPEPQGTDEERTA